MFMIFINQLVWQLVYFTLYIKIYAMRFHHFNTMNCKMEKLKKLSIDNNLNSDYNMFYPNSDYFYLIRNEICRKSDPPQAENPALQNYFYI